MRLFEFSLLYFLFGGGAWVAAWRVGGGAIDGLLLFLFWPLYGPIFLLGQAPRGLVDGREAAFLAALVRAKGTPLAGLLPGPQEARSLARRLRIASQKVGEIDQALARPEFSEEEARRRYEELQAPSASDAARTAAGLRLHNIARLKTLRDRFSRELDEVSELLSQLTTQAEVMRLAGGIDPSTAELARELLARVEGLDHVLDDGGPALSPVAASRPALPPGVAGGV